MNQTYLEHVANAKESLKIWFSNVEQMHNGIQMFSKENGLDRNKTDFAKWYYGEGQTFSSFEAFNVLDPFYNEMYDLFIEYSNLNNTPVKKGLFSNHAEKRRNELTIIFFNLKKVARKLIKSVELFEEKLMNSPLFKKEPTYNETKERIVDSTRDSLPLDEVVAVDKIAENNQSNIIEVESISSQEQKITPPEKTLQTQNEIDFEKRLQEEVAKIKKQLEEEFSKKQIDATENSPKPESKPETETKQEYNTNLKSTDKKSPDIDLEEEIRRILS